jgi:hypothetical protein
MFALVSSLQDDHHHNVGREIGRLRSARIRQERQQEM